MRIPQFEHLAPTQLEDACSFLAAHEGRAVALAGGTDLLVKMKQRKIIPHYVVNLKGITGLEGINHNEDGFKIGPLTTIQALKNASLLKRGCKILVEAAAAESSVQIRNIATLGGNIVNASPAADAPLALIVAKASLVLARVGRRRTVLVENFFTAPGKTILAPGELISEILVPPPPLGTGVSFLKHALRRTDIAIVSAAAALTLREDICTDAIIGLGSVAPTIIRARMAEAILVGKTITPELINEAAQTAVKECSPIDDIRRSARYRRNCVADITNLVITRALQDAKGTV